MRHGLPYQAVRYGCYATKARLTGGRSYGGDHRRKVMKIQRGSPG